MKSMILRYVLAFVGIALIALGVALTTRADLGTTAISALPYVACLGFGGSLGTYTGLFNLLLVAVQIAILRKEFPKLQYLQIPVTLCFAFFIDLWMFCIPEFSAQPYACKLAVLAAGVLATAAGIFVEVKADVVMMAGEGAVKTLCLVLRRDFGILKTYFDVTLVALGVLLSFILFAELRGIGEGTILSAVLVGVCVKAIHSLCRRFT